MTIDPRDPLAGFKPPARETITARAAALMGWSDADLGMVYGIARSTAQLWRTRDNPSRDQLVSLARKVARRIADLENLLDDLDKRGA